MNVKSSNIILKTYSFIVCVFLYYSKDNAWSQKYHICSKRYLGHNIFFFQADRVAAGLLQLGLVPGDRVGLWGPNSSAWYISRLAIARAGLVAVSTNILHLSTLKRK